MARTSLRELTRGAAALTREEALVVVGLMAISCDGKVDPAEIPELIAALTSMGIPADGTDEQREDMVLRIVGMCDREGMDSMLGSAFEGLPDPAIRERALALTVRLLLCDGEIPVEEFDFLRELHDVLEISIDRYEHIVGAGMAR